MPKAPLSIADVARRCGSCGECCTHLPIPPSEVMPSHKPAGETCIHRCATGCRIYSRRPGLCADFRCAWHRDTSWPAVWRPDHSGLMCLREEIEPALPAAAIYEIRSRALAAPEGKRIIEEIKRTTVVLAIVDEHQCRRRVMGDLVYAPAHPAVPAPHILGRPQETLPIQRPYAA